MNCHPASDARARNGVSSVGGNRGRRSEGSSTRAPRRPRRSRQCGPRRAGGPVVDRGRSGRCTGPAVGRTTGPSPRSSVRGTSTGTSGSNRGSDGCRGASRTRHTGPPAALRLGGGRRPRTTQPIGRRSARWAGPRRRGSEGSEPACERSASREAQERSLPREIRARSSARWRAPWKDRRDARFMSDSLRE